MNNIRNIILSAFTLVSFAAFILFSCAEEKPLVVTGNIEGTVADEETNSNLSSVNVIIVSNSNTTFAEQSKLTGSDGKFSFKDLEAGNYKLTFTKNGYEDNSKNVNLIAGQTSSSDISLKPIKSVISVQPASLDFGQDKNILPIEIRNTGKSELNWSIVEDLPWLSVNPVSGKTTTEPTPVTVSVDRSAISGDTKTGTFVVNSNGGSVVVTVTVGKAGAVMSVTPATLDFGNTETEKSLNISNTGVGTLTYKAETGQSWVTLSGAEGSTSTDTKIIKVTVNRAGLSPNNYSGSVIINSNSNSITVPVSMTVVQSSIPSVLNGQVSGITYNSAQISANITSIGSSEITQHGHCWSTAPNPTTADNKTTLGGTNTTGSFTSNLSGLNANITYYVKAYATNSVGTAYSDAVTFTTLAPPTMATVQTLSTANVGHNSLDATGNLTVLGDGLVTDYGFCYSSSKATPTVADGKASKGQTTQTGQFTVTVDNLQPSTKYYIRAYATNSMGTAYGTVIEAATTDAPPPVTSGLVAYYTFDNDDCNEAQGKTEYNGTKQGSGNPVFSTDIPGKSGKSLQLNKDAYYYVATNPIPRSAQYSYSIWLKTMSNCTVWTHQTSSYSYMPSLQIYNNKVGTYFTSGWTYFNIDVSQLLLDGNWHLLTITRNAASHKLFIDGTYYATITNTSTASDNPYPLQIGNGFIGKMDNMRVYNRELTQAEITELFNGKQ